MDSPMLEARGLQVRLGGEAILHGLDFEIREGERLGLIGPNGAGKTTLLEAMAGLLPLADGTVMCQGALFYLPDGITPWPDLRVGIWTKADSVCLFDRFAVSPAP